MQSMIEIHKNSYGVNKSRDLLSNKNKAAVEQSWYKSTLSAVDDKNDMRDGLHTRSKTI